MSSLCSSSDWHQQVRARWEKEGLAEGKEGCYLLCPVLCPVLCRRASAVGGRGCSGMWFSKASSSGNSKGMYEMSKQPSEITLHCRFPNTAVQNTPPVTWGWHKRKPARHSKSRAAQFQPVQTQTHRRGAAVEWVRVHGQVSVPRGRGRGRHVKTSPTVYASSTLCVVLDQYKSPSHLPIPKKHLREELAWVSSAPPGRLGSASPPPPLLGNSNGQSCLQFAGGTDGRMEGKDCSSPGVCLLL